MTRIISGEFGGRRILVPKSHTRPTTDRVREAMFSSIESRLGEWAGVRVLDLFAGSGALGIEAISRGAASAEFVDSAAQAVTVVKKNLATLSITARVHHRSASAFSAGSGDGFDLVFADPPYDLPAAEITAILAGLAVHDRLADEALIVVEQAKGSALIWPEGFESAGERTYGQTVLWYGHFHG